MRYGLPLALTLALALAPSRCAQDGSEPETTRVQPPPSKRPSYQIMRTGQGIRVDGRLAEEDWRAAPPLYFIMPWNDVDREGAQSTVVRLLWDDENLYIVYECLDPFLDAKITAHDGQVSQEDAVEFFVTPHATDVSTYFGYEMNINGTLLDYIAFGGGREWTPNIHFAWQSEDVKIATTYDGTLNDHSDTDRGWVLEIAIPHDNFRHLGGQIPPQDGDIWRAGLNRSAGHGGQFSLWSDTHTAKPSFHHAAYFGELTFSDAVVGR